MSLFPKDRDLTRPPEEVELAVDASFLRLRADEVHIRLDAFLGHHIRWRSRTSIQALVREGFVLVDPSTPEHPRGSGELAVERRPGRKLRHGSRVVVVIPPEQRVAMVGSTSRELVVLYEDEGVLAVDKAAGTVVHPSGRHLVDTLIQRVHAVYGGEEELERGGAPRLCHRLDRETSGVVLVGKHPEAHRDVMQQFEERRVEKEYLAIVRGVPERAAGVVDLPLGPCRRSAVGLKMGVLFDGQPARTEWRVVARWPAHALVACRPVTGRQHQLRVHLEALGHPVVGDKLYGYDESYFGKGVDGELDEVDLAALEMPRHALHNRLAAFRSPATGQRVCVESPLPPDMATFLRERAGPCLGATAEAAAWLAAAERADGDG